jgi:CBS domain-containing protein
MSLQKSCCIEVYLPRIHYPVATVDSHGLFVLKKAGHLPHDDLDARGDNKQKGVRAMSTQIVRNWMTLHPITITPQTTLPEAKQLLLNYHIRRLPVLNQDKLVGIVTWRDINRAELSTSSILNLYEFHFRRARMTAREFMSTAVVTISPDATIGEAAGLMIERKIGGLPVVEDGQLIGMITETDVCIFVLQVETAV